MIEIYLLIYLEIFLFTRVYQCVFVPIPTKHPGKGVLQYMAGYIVMCHSKGYSFQAVFSGIRYTNQRVWVYNRVSFSRKLIIGLIILVQTGETGNCHSKNIKKSNSFCFPWSVLLTSLVSENSMSTIWQQNSLKLALVKAKASRVPTADPNPNIHKVPPTTRPPPKTTQQFYLFQLPYCSPVFYPFCFFHSLHARKDKKLSETHHIQQLHGIY